MNDIDKSMIIEGLHSGVVEITFEKKDGTERVLQGTLVMSSIPEEKLPKSDNYKSTDEVQRVFDVEKEDWRSFRWDSVKHYTYI